MRSTGIVGNNLSMCSHVFRCLARYRRNVADYAIDTAYALLDNHTVFGRSTSFCTPCNGLVRTTSGVAFVEGLYLRIGYAKLFLLTILPRTKQGYASLASATEAFTRAASQTG
jgi:hypothetical protein